MKANPPSLDQLERQLDYFKERTRALGAKLFQADRLTSALRHELEQKRRGFTLLAQLSAELRPDDVEAAFSQVARQLNGALNMQRTLVLQARSDGRFTPLLTHGYPPELAETLAAAPLSLPPALLSPSRLLRLTSAPAPEELRQLAAKLLLPYFVSTAVAVNGKVIAVLLSGRLKEQPPFLPVLEESDGETVQAIGGLLSSVLAQHQLQEMSHQAHHDALTGLPNLRLAMDRLQQALQQTTRTDDKVGLLFIDLDGFKGVNDRMGHDVGDTLLCALAARMRTIVRQGDTIARLGGDEFIVIMPGLTAPEQATHIAERLLAALSQPLQVKNQLINVGASIGLAYGPEHGHNAEALLQAADQAMYHIKRNGKHGYALANATPQAKTS